MNASLLPSENTSTPLTAHITDLTRAASLEMNVQDVKFLGEVRTRLDRGTRIFISHLPKQRFAETAAICEAAARQGFDPVPHLPVRLVESQSQLDAILGTLSSSGARELLLISGDYPSAAGPFSEVSQVLATGLLTRHGFTRVSIAGHPEGHPKVPTEEIRRAERNKVRLATEQGLEVSLVTQFLFEAAPFVTWARELRANGVHAHLRCGLAGPAKVTTLLRYAMRCGVGASVRALGTHTASVFNVIADHGPDSVLTDLAQSRLNSDCDLHGVHLFAFGGLVRTAEWLAKASSSMP